MFTKSKVSHVILGLSALLMLACQPVDQKINRPNTGSDGDQPLNQQGMDRAETMKLLAVQMDRLAEPLHVLKAVLDPNYRELYKLQLSTPLDASEVLARVDLNNVILQSVNLPASANTAKTMSKAADLHLNVKRLLIDQDGKLQQAVFVFEDREVARNKDAQEKEEVPVRNQGVRLIDGKPADFSSTLRFETISIEPVLNEPDTYRIRHVKIEDTNSKKDKNTLIQTKIHFLIQWSGEAKDLDGAIQIKELNLQSFRSGNKSGQIRIRSKKDTPVQLSLQLGPCAKMDGSMTFESRESIRGKNGKSELVWLSNDLKAVDSTYLMPGQIQSESVSCDSRPVVDLSRML